MSEPIDYAGVEYVEDPRNKRALTGWKKWLSWLVVLAVVIGVWFGTQAILESFQHKKNPGAIAATSPYESKELGFAAAFSGTPDKSESDQVIAGIPVHSSLFEFSTAYIYEAVGTTEFPQEVFDQDRDQMLQNAFDGAVGNVEGATGGPTTLFDLRGERALRGTMNRTDGDPVNMVITAHNYIQYFLLDQSDDKAHTKFLASFRFLD